MMRLFAATVLLSLALPACDRHDAHDHPRAISSEQLYLAHCAACHQQDGSGAFLRGVPPLKPPSLGYRQLADQILGHSRSDDTRMPVFAGMPRAEAEVIAVYIHQKLRFK